MVRFFALALIALSHGAMASEWTQIDLGAGSLPFARLLTKSSLVSATCTAKALRPEYGETSLVADGTAGVDCEALDSSYIHVPLHFSFADSPVSSWGNRYDTMPFTVGGDAGSKLFHLIKDFYKAHPKETLLDRDVEMAPNNLFFTVSYDILRAAGHDALGSVLCDQSAEIEGASKLTQGLTTGDVYPSHDENGKPIVYRAYDTHCTFIYQN